ncbi:MAG: (2Fe-2S)-binding protein [Actinomycetota bacterium]
MSLPCPVTDLDGLAGLGPYFAVSTHGRHSVVRGPWVLLRSLLDTPEALRDRSTEVRAALAGGSGLRPGAVEFRVAVSVAHLGLVARLLSPAIGAVVSAGRQLTVDPARVWWQPVLGGPVPLSFPADALAPVLSGAPGDFGRAVGPLRETVLAGPVRRLTELAGELSLSPQVAWGNVASAINGSGAMIARGTPGLAARAQETCSALLRYGPLRQASTGRPAAAGFRRRSCCLIYRVSAGGQAAYCGDCILGPPGHTAGD